MPAPTTRGAAPERAPAEPSSGAGWSSGALQKVSWLVAARIASQVLGAVWFIVVARIFDPAQLGTLASGLVTFAAVSVIGDVGTTWSIARDVTAAPDRARSLYGQGVRIRLLSVTIVGALALAGGALLVERPILVAMTIGVGMALASGVTEIGLTTLRSVGEVRFEALALPGERAAFLALASAALLADLGPNAILLSYLTANIGTATLARRRVSRLPGLDVGERHRLWSSETRLVGLAFAVLALGPRANGLVLVLLADRIEIAGYSVASRPIEQIALTLIGFSTTMLPLFRDDHVHGRHPEQRVAGLVSAMTIVAIPGLALLALAPQAVIDLLYGEGRYPTVGPILALVAAVAVAWPARGLVGMLMVATDRARPLAVTATAGLGLGLALAVPFTLQWGAIGAAAALIISEAVTLLAMVARAGLRLPPDLDRHLRLAAAGTAIAVVALTVLPLPAMAAVAGLATAALTLVTLDAGRHAARGGHITWT